MKILDKKNKEIINDTSLESKFLSVNNNTFDINCKFLNDDFFIDSHNYYPISSKFNSFSEIFQWGEKSKYSNFYSEKFLINFNKNMSKFKHLSNIVVLGSSSVDNYYRNMITFFPRIFFLDKQKIKLAIHRNSSNKFRNFISIMCNKMGINLEFIYLDDGFYKFTNSKIPQFLNKNDSLKILNKLIIKSNNKSEKIYLTRQNAEYRNLINEGDVIQILKRNGFKIVDLNDFNIIKQLDLFSKSKVIVSPTGSSLTNIAFCSPGTKVIEIIPKYKFSYENNFKDRYAKICKFLDLDYHSLEADPIKIDKLDKRTDLFISPKALKESNYYKNLLLKIEKVNQIVKIQQEV
tara:strand:+ start:275 stop:1318 length:1044 start_codon:yes stop_codon:yes gene_type:complete